MTDLITHNLNYERIYSIPELLYCKVDQQDSWQKLLNEVTSD